MPLCMDLKKEFDIKAINALHYFEYKSNFIFQSDYHDDWRLFYVEQGACEISFSNTGKEPVIVETHGIFIEAPEEYYSFKSARADSCLLLCAGFQCDSPSLSLLADRPLTSTKDIRNLLMAIVQEGQQCFSTQVNTSGQYVLDHKFNSPIGGEQLIGAYLEMLLIHMIRQYCAQDPETWDRKKEPDQTDLSKSDSVLLKRITDYYSSHMMAGVTVAELCGHFDIGRSHLQRIFREQTGYSAIDYFLRMRIHKAKQLIQEDRMSLTETSRALGYTSLHYFSRQFKQITGIPPSMYQQTIRNADHNPVCQHIGLDNLGLTPTVSPDTVPALFYSG